MATHDFPPSDDPDAAATRAPQSVLSTGYKRGPAIGTLLLGILLLAVAAVTLLAQLSDRPVAYDVAGPYVVIGAGLVIAAIGGLAAIGRRRPQTTEATDPR